MRHRFFVAQVLIVTDEAGAVENEWRESDDPVTADELRNYLKKALRLDWDDNNHSNPCGICLMEMQLPELRQLTDQEAKALQGKKYEGPGTFSLLI